MSTSNPPNKPKIIMTHSENSGVGLYRIWMQAKELRKLGWDVFTLPDELPDISVDKWEQITKGVDLIVSQRTDNPELVALMLAAGDLNNCPVVYETDDDIYDVSQASPAYEFFYPGSPLLEVSEIYMHNVNAITVSTQALADRYGKFNSNVHVLRNCQDMDMWRGVRRSKPAHLRDKVVIGWAGSSTHYDDLALIRRPIKKLLRNNPNVVFRVLGIVPDFLVDHPQVELVKQWAPAREWPKKLATLGFDIGIAPVVHRPFNLGKSNIKWQEYSMLGIPTVASRVGEYKEIESGVTGLLANDEHEWYAQMERLVRNEQLRREIGGNAKQYVKANCTIQVNIKEWDDAYRQIISQHKAVNGPKRKQE